MCLPCQAYNGTVAEFMLKTRSKTDADTIAAPPAVKPRPRIALLSNPKSTGNLAQLPRIRAFCADHPDIFHYEVEHADQVGQAMKTIAQVRPKVLAINGGDGTVQAALTEIHNGGHFGDNPPPVAVLPSGKTNLIAIDLGARGDPIHALERLIELAQSDLEPYIVYRELIALRHSGNADRPAIGMFLGGAGLADTMIWCRDKVYPLGLPNGVAHVLTAIALLAKMLLRIRASFLPPDLKPLQVSLREAGNTLSGRYSLLAVTTLEKLLLSGELVPGRGGSLKLLAIEERPATLIRAFFASLIGKIGKSHVRGVHFEEADEIMIEGESSNVILDGETFRAELGRPIMLSPAQPLSFVKLAA
jgi:hypothetical protein